MKRNPDPRDVVSIAADTLSQSLTAQLREAGIIMLFIDEFNERVTATRSQGGELKSLLNSAACLQSILLGGELRDEH
ncbi:MULTISPECIES: hypothetical protein [unclassified Mesorhizobium]|uniref:hypothetical protein n=1 Tax=unclassified Mesorhizobium TaxID=325217 RepID=UPI00112892CC|nr:MULTISPECIES: hypothetical protein [unclassified Mesorhizobium]MBZ9696462.1 hypothetical protein [Mesorhizobium sp. CO1-1-9]TPK11622.1 hypothetical protein FJ543_19740 [Mesorhizobium sp. B2-5-7]